MKRYVLKKCYTVLALIVAVLGIATILQAGSPDGGRGEDIKHSSSAKNRTAVPPRGAVVVPPNECMSEEDTLAGLLSGEQTRLAQPVKVMKNYEPGWRAARVRGVQPVITTLYSIHSRESVPVLKGQPLPDEVLDELFRCRGFGAQRRLDPRLVEIILAAALHFEAQRVDIISAFRSPKFNDALAKKGRRVASESKHTFGRAIDFSLSTTPATELGRWLWENFEGGVGTYARDNFVHVDVGRKRRWRGR